MAISLLLPISASRCDAFERMRLMELRLNCQHDSE